MPTSPHKRTLYIVLACHFILHTQVAPISTSPLPATLCPLYLPTYKRLCICICISSPTLPIASHMNPHHRLSSLIRNRPHFLRGALFHFQIAPEPGRKRAPPPKPMSSTFNFYTPTSVAVMSTSPREINLCPMLLHHFLLHAKSLPGP